MFDSLLGYLLSKQEGQPGTPEKPLSDLGRVSYHAYWKSVILEYLHEHRDDEFSVEAVCQETGMYSHDVAATLQLLGMIRQYPDGGLALVVDWKQVDNHAARVQASRTRIPLDPECLRWTPLVTTVPARDEEKEVSIEVWISLSSDLHFTFVVVCCCQCL